MTICFVSSSALVHRVLAHLQLCFITLCLPPCGPRYACSSNLTHVILHYGTNDDAVCTPCLFAAAGDHDADKQRMVQQMVLLDTSYNGGLRQYIHNARQLLQDSKEGECMMEQSTPTAGVTITLSWIYFRGFQWVKHTCIFAKQSCKDSCGSSTICTLYEVKVIPWFLDIHSCSPQLKHHMACKRCGM